MREVCRLLPRVESSSDDEYSIERRAKMFYGAYAIYCFYRNKSCEYAGYLTANINSVDVTRKGNSLVDKCNESRAKRWTV